MKEHHKISIDDYTRMVSKCGEIWPFDDRRLAIKPLYIYAGFGLLEPGSECSDLIGAKSALNSLYHSNYFSDRAEVCQYCLLQSAFLEIIVKMK